MKPDELKRLEALETEIANMKRGASFPFEMGNAIAERMFPNEQVISRASTTAANIYKTVDTSGASANVFAFPDKFFKLAGKDFYIPAYKLTQI